MVAMIGLPRERGLAVTARPEITLKYGASSCKRKAVPAKAAFDHAVLFPAVKGALNGGRGGLWDFFAAGLSEQHPLKNADTLAAQGHGAGQKVRQVEFNPQG
jgi:hypothetical protein